MQSVAVVPHGNVVHGIEQLPRSFLIEDRTGQCVRKREAERQAWTHRKSFNGCRLGDLRRTSLLAVQSKWWRVIISSDQQTIQKDQFDHYH